MKIEIYLKCKTPAPDLWMKLREVYDDVDIYKVVITPAREVEAGE